MKRYSYGERDYSFGQQHFFAPGREEEENCALWKTAHQKVLLDDCLQVLIRQLMDSDFARYSQYTCVCWIEHSPCTLMNV
jgi:hypothetical protein